MANVSETAVVTGGSAGIGRAIAEAMLASGRRVVSLDRRPPDVSHPALETVEVDLFDPKATAQAAREIAARHAVTHLVHNAGVIRQKRIEEASASDIADLAQLHLGAALTLMQAVLPGMRERRFGRVVLIASRAALGAVGRTAYAATKSGIYGMARSWALELARDGITVNVVSPGPVKTDMFREVIPDGSAKEAELANAIPVGRIGLPSDVVRAVMFFGAADADFVTGQTLYVCGGASIGALAL